MLGTRSAPRRRKRWSTRLFAVLIGAALALGGGELLVRHLVFGDSAFARRFGKPLRDQAVFGLGFHHDDYWKLQVLLTPGVELVPPGADPHLGWVGSIEPGTYAHRDEATIGERRPILLFGDSNAECLTGPELCFQGLLERSDLADRYALLNYGVGGYGLDQIWLLMQRVLPRFEGRDPIVIASLMVDDDLERSMLTFRGWPKPRLLLDEHGELVHPGPVDTDTLRFLHENPPEIPSYLLSLVRANVRGPEARQQRSAEELAELEALNRAILDAMEAELTARELDHFFFLFYFDNALRGRQPAAWSDEVVLRFLRESGAPHVSMRDVFEALCEPSWACLDRFAGKNDPTLAGHFNDGGNRLAFEAMRQGFEGEVSLERLRELDAAGAFEPTGERFRFETVLGRSVRIHSRALYPCFRQESSPARPGRTRLGLRAGADLATTLTLFFDGTERRLLARASAVTDAGRACPGERLVVRWRVDEGEWRERTFEAGGAAEELAVEFEGAYQLTFEVVDPGPDAGCLWFALQGLRIE